MSQSGYSKDPKQIPQGVIQGLIKGEGLTVGVVTARWNEDITYKLEEGAIQTLKTLGADVRRVRVPGAVEVPLAAQHLLEIGVDGVIAIACVIRGETTHYESVCSSVERGCSDLQLEYNKPVTFGVLTVENKAQALDRVGGKHGHKGIEAAEVCLEMIQLKKLLK